MRGPGCTNWLPSSRCTRLFRTAGTDAQRWSAADELGSPSHGKQVTQDFHNLPGGERSSNLDRQALASEFVDHYQEPNLSSIFGSIGDEVVRPDVILV